MKSNIFIKINLTLLVAITFFSCASKKNIIYLQGETGSDVEKGQVSYVPKLQPDDMLMIIVSAENPEVAAPYNVKLVSFSDNSGLNGGSEQLQSYLIDSDGDIEFPMLGKIHLGGLSRIEAIEKIKKTLVNHIKDPVVNLRILNFKISVLGEVSNPGMHTIKSDRVTLLEALSLSGDMTIYGNRKSVTIIREIEGVKIIEKVDITKKDFINSPYYYLVQNDVVYIEPNQTKVNSSIIGPNIAIGLSAVSLLITIIVLTTR